MDGLKLLIDFLIRFSFVGLIMIPFGVWKLVEIAIWIFKHVKITF